MMRTGGEVNAITALRICGTIIAVNLAIPLTGGNINAMPVHRTTSTTDVANIVREASFGMVILAHPVREGATAGTIIAAISARTINTGTERSAATTRRLYHDISHRLFGPHHTFFSLLLIFPRLSRSL